MDKTPAPPREPAQEAAADHIAFQMCFKQAQNLVDIDGVGKAARPNNDSLLLIQRSKKTRLNRNEMAAEEWLQARPGQTSLLKENPNICDPLGG